MYRELAAADPDRYFPELAATLTNLGSWLSELECPDQALGPTGEATALYRELAEADPDSYRPKLAATLSNSGTWLAQLGHPDQALGPSEEAVALYRQLAASQDYGGRRPAVQAATRGLHGFGAKERRSAGAGARAGEQTWRSGRVSS